MAALPKQFNTIACIKKLREANFTQAQAEVVAEVVESQAQTIHDQQSEIDGLKSKGSASPSDIKESELRLQKEIEMVRGDLRESELRLQTEIELVRSDLRATELRLQTEIEVVRSDLREAELRLQTEIEVVRSDLRKSELRLQKEIEVVRKEIEVLRGDIKADIKNLEIKMLMLYGGGFIALLGVLAKGFHWL